MLCSGLVPTHLTVIVLAVADGLPFGLYGSERWGELFIGIRPQPLPSPSVPSLISPMWLLWTLSNMKERKMVETEPAQELFGSRLEVAVQGSPS